MHSYRQRLKMALHLHVEIYRVIKHSNHACRHLERTFRKPLLRARRTARCRSGGATALSCRSTTPCRSAPITALCAAPWPSEQPAASPLRGMCCLRLGLQNASKILKGASVLPKCSTPFETDRSCARTPSWWKSTRSRTSLSFRAAAAWDKKLI